MATKENTTKRREATAGEKKHAEWLYVERDLPLATIAAELGRNIKTISDWRDKGGWDETKELFKVGPTRLRQALLQSAVRVLNGEQRTDKEGNPIKEVDADSLSKIMKAYDYVSRKASPSVCRDILIELDNFICQHDPRLAAQNTQYHRLFLIHKIEQENNGN